MDSNARERINAIKTRIIRMLEERQALAAGQTAEPSKLWSDTCSFFDYMLSLPAESFSKLRTHTYHFTADNYQTYSHGRIYPRIVEAFKNRWKKLIADIPTGYVITEPNEGVQGIGYEVEKGVLISEDTLKFQATINTLCKQGILTSLKNGEHKFILEIGTGYGGLAHQLHRMISNTTYVMVDLPETLLFAAAYLTLLNPSKRIYIYSPEDHKSALQEAVSFDFILFPNYKVNELQGLKFSLVLNVRSLQEMTTEQAKAYLDFIKQTCVGTFYSWNQDRYPQNSQLTNLTELLRSRFQLTEISQPKNRPTLKQQMRHLAYEIIQIVHPKIDAALAHEYLCVPI
jgi:hypothetical protein